MNQKIKILIGISGVGKSSWATNYIKENSQWYKVNRDSIRLQLTGDLTDYYNRNDVNFLEKRVTEIQYETIRNILLNERNIIIDNTNLDKKYIEEIIYSFNHLADIEIVVFDADLPIDYYKSRAKERDHLKDSSYIDKQYSQFKNIVKEFKGKTYPKTNYKAEQNTKLPKAYIFDIDGTLAENKLGRNIYNPKDEEILKDSPIQQTIDLVDELGFLGNKIIFVSGREDKFYEVTKQWLLNNTELNTIELYMRKTGDQRKDFVIKEEILKTHILPKYNVLAAFDDRLRIIENWNKLGIFTFNVNQTNKRF